MRLIRVFNSAVIRPFFNNSVVTIGNFDGLHRGHQQLINELLDIGQLLAAPTVLVTFEPLPSEFFSQKKLARISRFREKYQLLMHYGIDNLIILSFDQALAAMTADEFVEVILVKSFGVKAVVVGSDFRFGAQRRGDLNTLRQLGERYQFKTIEVPDLIFEGRRISSTWVREALQQGDLSLADQLLGRHYYLSGRVVPGAGRGQQLGFRTANINLQNVPIPLTGVYVVRVLNLNANPIEGVANIGTRPTFAGSETVLEVHLFDFHENLYGQRLEIEFLKKIRGEKRFETKEELIQQIKNDIEQARIFYQEGT